MSRSLSAAAPSAGPWPMPPLVRATLGIHAAAAAAAAALPQSLPWAAAAVALNHVVLTAAGLWPRSSLLGPNVTRLPADRAEHGDVALTIDDGPDPEVTPAVLEVLDQYEAKATFFCIAERVREYPAIARRIVSRGHSVQNHSRDHRHNFSLLGPAGYERQIGDAQRLIADTTGVAPLFFRAPAGLRNPFLDPVLHRLGLTLVSWTRRGFDTRESDPLNVLRRLTRNLRGGDILLLHDGNARRDPDGSPIVLEVLPQLLVRLHSAGLRTVTLHDALPPRVHPYPS